MSLPQVVVDVQPRDGSREPLARLVHAHELRHDLDLNTADGPLRLFELLHDARPLLLNLGRPGDLDTAPWADRIQLLDASYDGDWELPVLGPVSAPAAALVRPDGYVAWVGEGTDAGLIEALATWFGAA